MEYDPPKLKVSNRSPSFQNKDRRYISKNIRDVKNISNLNQLKALNDNIKAKNDLRNNSFSNGINSKQENFVFFKRTKTKERFNEGKYVDIII